MRIYRGDKLGDIFVDGVNHQGVQVRVGKSQEKHGVLVKEQECVADMNLVVESIDADRTAAFLQVKFDDFV